MLENETEVLEEDKSNFWKDFIKFVVIAALVILPIRTWVAQPFIVRGSSMEPNFEDGEYLIIDELSYNIRSPKRGEVIVFRYPVNPSQFFIKRVVGLPNETIEIRDNRIFLVKDSTLEEIEEPYLSEALTTPDSLVTLGDDEYYVMGDNRLASSDSRKWGSLPKNLIVGRALLRLWPPTSIDFLPAYHSFNFISSIIFT